MSSSRGNKVIGAQMSATKNRVKDEFKQFLPPSSGARGRRGTANAISSSATSKQTYKADKMTPYLFMGLQQMRTAGGRKQLVDSGTFNFSGPVPSTDIFLEPSKIASELSGNLRLACGVFVGVSFEFGAPYIHHDICSNVLESISMLRRYRNVANNDAEDLAPIQLYPNGSVNDISNIRVVPKGGVGVDSSSGHVFFDMSVAAVPAVAKYWPTTQNFPFHEYKFTFNFKQGAAFTEAEKKEHAHPHHASIYGGNGEVFAFHAEERLKSSFSHSNHAEFTQGERYKYFYEGSTYPSAYFRLYAPNATEHNGVDVSARFLESGSALGWFTSHVDKDTGTHVFEHNSGGLLDSEKEYHIQDISFVLKNKAGASMGSGSWKKYDSDVSYAMNQLSVERRIFNKPTAADYEDGKQPNKMLLRVGEAATDPSSVDLSFNGGLWTSDVTMLFGPNDISYSVGSGSYTKLDVNSGVLDTSNNVPLKERRFLKIISQLKADAHDDVHVRFNLRGPSNEVVLANQTVTLISGDIMPLATSYKLESSSNLVEGYTLAKADAQSKNKVFLKFDDTVFETGDLKTVTIMPKGQSDFVVPAGSTAAHVASQRIEVSFNVQHKVDHNIVLNMSKIDTNTSVPTASYEFLVPASDIYEFPQVNTADAKRIVGGTQYSLASDMSRALDLPYLWGLTHSSNKPGVSVLGLAAANNGSQGSHFNGVMDISSIDISCSALGLPTTYSRVSDVSLSKIIQSSFDLSFVHKFSADASYDLSYTFRHGDIEYTRYQALIMTPDKLKD